MTLTCLDELNVEHDSGVHSPTNTCHLRSAYPHLAERRASLPRIQERLTSSVIKPRDSVQGILAREQHVRHATMAPKVSVKHLLQSPVHSDTMRKKMSIRRVEYDTCA
jgi:hypothetical protein